VDLLSGARSQEDRLTAFNDLKQGKCRIMVATDVASRGIDVEGVDMIVNFDIPNESATYIHRGILCC
jgi:superfamily II DNA/RNA helicase